LIFFTNYPSQVIGVGESISLTLTLRSVGAGQSANLEIKDLPDGWTASMKGGGHTINAVYVDYQADTSVDLRIDPPIDVAAGTYDFAVIAKGEHGQAQLPLEFTVKEKTPASLDYTVDLAVIRGKPDTTFHYNVTLKNTGDDDLSVDLSADPTQFYNVTFKSGTNEVTNIPVNANSTKRLTVDVAPFSRTAPAGTYQVTLHAKSGDVQASIDLTAEVVGTSSISLGTPDGKLSGNAEVGTASPVTLVIQNDGTAPAHGITFTATKPTGWDVTYDPAQIDQLDPGQAVEVTASLKPADKALAGDYVVTFRANSQDSTSDSADYRVTVMTSTLWGLIGIAVVAVAVLVVGLSVMRFGRR
jgi:uncharacterized membrane protein